ncbi:CapA family protein [Alteribacter natronophilus]|uniref:CapA family protein n=1 Tax=Alteribacter natronophilus TaxID=2583810 RepID=UPI00110EEE40|nr:CapA family protein [Alteribacter natronophilus]TMW72324.1 hypothetical protein FGB90_08955 [Alteribacter natronophilus]
MAYSSTITIAGDTSLGEYYLDKPKWQHIHERLKNDPSSFFKEVSPLTAADDYFILNFESVFLDGPAAPLEGKQYPNWDEKDKILSVFNELGVNAVTMANNHALDFGEEPFLNTVKAFETGGFKTVGAGADREEASAPLELSLKGEYSEQKVFIFTGMRASKRYREDYGFIAKKDKAGVNSLALSRMQKRIRDIRDREPEAIILVIPHWQGRDYKWASDNERIRERCQAILEAGADHIIGHGTHMANEMTLSDGKLIAYSIGNYVFNSPGRYASMDAPPYSLLAKLQFTEQDGKWETGFRFYPIVTDNRKTDFSVRPVTPEECRECLKALTEKNGGELVYRTGEDEKGYYFTVAETTEHYRNFGLNINMKEHRVFLDSGLLSKPEPAFLDEVQAHWEKGTGEKIDTSLHAAFHQLTGRKEKDLIPTSIVWKTVVPYLNGSSKKNVYRDKNLYEQLLDTDRMAKTAVKRVRGVYYDSENNVLSSGEAEGYLRGASGEGVYIVKPSTTNNGTGIYLIEMTEEGITVDGKPQRLADLESYYGPNFTIQHIVKQHRVMAKPHQNSVNTLRMVTLRWEGQVKHLLTFARFGADGSIRDNAGTGGVCVGVDDKGRLLDFAIDEHAFRHDEHPSTGYSFKERAQIPNYGEFVQFVEELHAQILHHDFISWDVAVGEDGKPVFIEMNFRGVTWLYQLAAQKPLFGSLTLEILQKIKEETQETANPRDFRPSYFNSGTGVKKSKKAAGLSLKAAPSLSERIFGEGNHHSSDLDDYDAVKEQISDLHQLHREVDERFYQYYEELVSSKHMKIKSDENYPLYNELRRAVKPEHVSYATIKQFERRKMTLPKAMSYKEIMIEQSSLKQMGFPEHSWKLNKKTRGYQFADQIGLRRPHTDSRTYKFEEIPEQTGPVVVKPTSSRGSMGVYLIYSPDKILSVRRGKWLDSWAELEQDVLKQLERDQKRARPYLLKDEWMIEELILGVEEDTQPPSDLKFYCFYGEVLFVSETNPMYKKKFCYWDEDMNIVQTGRYDEQFYRGNGFTREELEMVKAASREIPAPFIRLDMLKGKDGLFFGEATPRSGHFQLFNEEFDLKMGESYRTAERRIFNDLFAGKSFRPFKEAMDLVNEEDMRL